jgi:putative transcriptional regulator
LKNCVRKLRNELGMTQVQLAEEMGVSRYTIIELEKGTQEPSGTLVLKLSNFFSKDAREIFLMILLYLYNMT